MIEAGLDDGIHYDLWIGLHLVDQQWVYVNGEAADYQDIHWQASDPSPGDECAYWHTDSSKDYELTTIAWSCTSCYATCLALCEFDANV